VSRRLRKEQTKKKPGRRDAGPGSDTEGIRHNMRLLGRGATVKTSGWRQSYVSLNKRPHQHFIRLGFCR
jgi:hypothetical protein